MDLQNQSVDKVCGDLISLLCQKMDSIEQYEEYIHDVLHDTQLTQLIVNMKHDDQRHLDTIRAHLARLRSEVAEVQPQDEKAVR